MVNFRFRYRLTFNFVFVDCVTFFDMLIILYLPMS